METQCNYRLPSAAENEAIAALFLGPKAENLRMVQELFGIILKKQAERRIECYPDDEEHITNGVKESDAFSLMSERLRNYLTDMTDALNRQTPFFSPRYIGHMDTDRVLPGVLGYLSTMLHNPNNLAYESSNVTMGMEIQVGKDLCELLGYSVGDTQDGPTAWGHITCGGSVANLEAILSARNLKFYPFAIRDAMKEGGPLDFIADTFSVEVTSSVKEKKLFKDLSTWELLNLTVPLINGLPEQLYDRYNISPTFLEGALRPYLVRTVSKDALEKHWGIVRTPQILIAKTMHFSWSKGAAIAGIGSDNVNGISVDNSARIDITKLREALLESIEMKQAVYMVVAIVGTTEAGSVDPLADIIALRDEMRERGLSFVVHADAAWGGYFTSIIRPDKITNNKNNLPRIGLRRDTRTHFHSLSETDSITIDPHKSGYVPYPAGGLCYRDARQRFFLTWTAPVLQQQADGESIGIYGIEGSKPGASAGAVFLAHKVIGLHENGYGVILGQAALNSRRFAAHWSSMSSQKTNFIVVPFNALPAEMKENAEPNAIEKQKEFIRNRIIGKTDEEIAEDPEALELFLNLGSELNVNAFVCNFRYPDGSVNTDVELANRLNWRIHERLCITTSEKGSHNIPLFIAGTKFGQGNYGDCATNFKRRLGLSGNGDLYVMRNSVLNPYKSMERTIDEIASLFKTVLQEEVQNVLTQCVPQPAVHDFFIQLQGETEEYPTKVFLVYHPSLYNASKQFQLILSATISTKKSSMIFTIPTSNLLTLRNNAPMLLSDLHQDSFEASIYNASNNELMYDDLLISDIKIIKKRILKTENYSISYPKLMPFYLYGTSKKAYIDHILLKAPNIQLTSGPVDLSITESGALKDIEIEEGLIVFAETLFENAMQPFPDTGDILKKAFFFTPGNKFKISIYKDPYPSIYEGPVDVTDVTEHVAEGFLTLQDTVHVDSTHINRNSTYEPVKVGDRLDRQRQLVNGKNRATHL